MKLVVDTSVWSLALRRRATAALTAEEQQLKADLSRAIEDGRVAMLGLIRQELLSGIREAAQFERVRAALEPFVDEQVKTTDHENAARLYNECRRRGVDGGPVDILICAFALQRGWRVLSNDQGLNRCLALGLSLQSK